MMKARLKQLLLKTMIAGVYIIGISTVAATSRYTGYQPEENNKLMDLVSELKGFK